MLRGEKVILRAVEREDLARLQELERDVDLVLLRDGVWLPFPLSAYERMFEKRLDEPDNLSFAIETDGKVIGRCGLHTLQRRDGIAAIGIGIVDRDYLGRGYGRDALNVLVDWAFRIQNYRRLWLDTIAPNERAIRSYAACGFVEEGRLRQHYYYNGTYVDAVVMGLLRTEWEARRAKAETTI